MPVWLLVILVIITVHRVTRLAVADELPLVRVPREWAVNWLDPGTGRAPLGGFGRSIAYLLTCPWCMSFWVGAAVVWATAHTVGLPAPVLVWVAASSVTGWAASAEAEHEQRWQLADHQINQAKGGLR